MTQGLKKAQIFQSQCRGGRPGYADPRRLVLDGTGALP